MTSRPMWDERYGREGYFFGTDPNDFLVERVAELPAGGELLCLGEGQGRNAVWLAARGFRVTGTDISPVGLEKAQQLAAERGVTITTIAADLADFDLGDSRWDAVLSLWVHVPRPLRESLHPRIARAVRPGGLFFLEHYHPRQLGYGTGGPPDPTWMLTLDELRRDFAPWHELHGVEKEREVWEGEYTHGGPSYVTQFIARRPVLVR
jgi:SAM-dependent methyltransferase